MPSDKAAKRQGIVAAATRDRRKAENSRRGRRKMPRSGKNSRRGRQKDLIWFVRICCLCALIRGLENLETPFGKGFNCCGAKLRLRCADSRFAKPRSFLKKVLIVAVRRCHCGALIRGLQNLGASCDGVRVVTFCVVQKVTKKHTGRSPATHDSKLCRK